MGLRLKRKVGQSIVVGNALITVIEVRGKYVHLNINAPSDVDVHRKEVFDRIAAEAHADGPETDSRCQHEAGANESSGTVCS